MKIVKTKKSSRSHASKRKVHKDHHKDPRGKNTQEDLFALARAVQIWEHGDPGVQADRLRSWALGTPDVSRDKK